MRNKELTGYIRDIDENSVYLVLTIIEEDGRGAEEDLIIPLDYFPVNAEKGIFFRWVIGSNKSEIRLIDKRWSNSMIKKIKKYGEDMYEKMKENGRIK